MFPQFSTPLEDSSFFIRLISLRSCINKWVYPHAERKLFNPSFLLLADIKKSMLRSLIRKNRWGSEPAPTIEKLAQALRNRDLNSALEFIKSRYSCEWINSRRFHLVHTCTCIAIQMSSFMHFQHTHYVSLFLKY